MHDKWFFTKDGKQRLGPFTSEQLYQLAGTGQLARSDMVLKVGKQKWVKAVSIRGLFSQPSQPSAVLQAVPVVAAGPPAQVAEKPEPSRHRKAKMLWWAVDIVAALVLLPVLIALLVSLDSQTVATIGSAIFLLLVVAVVVGGIIGLILAITGSRSSCPDCGKWWARVVIGERVLDEKKCYGLVTRRAYSSSSGSISGSSHHWGQADYQNISGNTHSSGSTSWQERVPVIRTTYQLIYECKFCDARWTRERVEEVEDFDIGR